MDKIKVENAINTVLHCIQDHDEKYICPVCILRKRLKKELNLNGELLL